MGLRAIILVVSVLAAMAARVRASAEFIYDADPPTRSCHASTIAEVKPGVLVGAWFGGTRERDPDVGIWSARWEGDGGWSKPIEVANGIQADGTRFPCWNPVLFQQPGGGALQLYFKVGPKPSAWWAMLIESRDAGRTWGKPRRLPDGILGPVKDKPILVGGELLCGSSTEGNGWHVHVERTADAGLTWTKTGPLNDAAVFGLIQPTLLDHGAAGLQMLCRSKQKVIVESWSHDGGKTWDPPAATKLPNPNSGIDAVVLKDGRSVLVYNDTPAGRSPLNVAVSADGKTWLPGPVLESEPGEYSYPAVIQTSDGLIHVTYTWRRKRIKHVVIDPASLPGRRPVPDASGK
jgi:predicted neuraminidase